MTKHRRQAPWLRALSAVTVIGARRVLSLQREPHLALFLSLSTNKYVYYFTSPALLPISFMWYSATNATFNTGETKRHLTDRDAPSHNNTLINHRSFRSLYPFCPFYGQHGTRSSRTHHLKEGRYSQGKRSISDLQGSWTFWVIHAWQNLICLFFLYPF